MSWLKGLEGRCECDHCGEIIGSKENIAFASHLYSCLLNLDHIHFCKVCNEKLNEQIRNLLSPFLKVQESYDISDVISENNLNSTIKFLMSLLSRGYDAMHLDGIEGKLIVYKTKKEFENGK